MEKEISSDKDTYIIYLNNIIAQGVDGIIYHTTKKNNQKFKMATKIMNKIIVSDIDNFIKIHKISSNYFGPEIFDIIITHTQIYLIMELMDCRLNDWIVKNISYNKDWNKIKKELRFMILPIHKKMKSKKITIGDKNIDNYMLKNGILKKIDFTMSILKNNLTYGDKKEFDYIYVINPQSAEMEKIHLNFPNGKVAPTT
jgi:hypothetical protein